MTALINKAHDKQSHYVHSSFFAIYSEFLEHLSQKKRSFYFPRFQKSLILDTISTPAIVLTLGVLVDLYRDELKEDFRKRVVGLLEEKISEWEARGLLKKKGFE